MYLLMTKDHAIHKYPENADVNVKPNFQDENKINGDWHNIDEVNCLLWYL